MPTHITCHWIPADGSGLPRREKAGGTYRAYVPDLLSTTPLHIDPEIAKRAAHVEQAISTLSTHEDMTALGNISRLLLRSEALSSSRIEGIAPRVDKVVLAELAQQEEIRGFNEDAEAVARNVHVLHGIEAHFRSEETISIQLLEKFQRELLGKTSIPTGIRTLQNWIGGNSYTPIGAEFIPAPPNYVPELMEDLCEYLNGAAHGALIQAALTHAQFETIHPFADGNGRVGRALIHGVLLRRNLIQRTILPISLILGTWSQLYIEGLTAFRKGDIHTWLNIFLDATEQAIQQAQIIANQLRDIQQQWHDALTIARTAQGKTRALRTDSIEAQLLQGLAGHPIVTTTSVQRIYGISTANARKALDSLENAGILRTKIIGKHGLQGYFSDDILSLIPHADRRLASSQFDTRLAAPQRRAVPDGIQTKRTKD
ncbi:Fic family protein [Corynebacterium sp. sy017]|uniref:Fic family protein n=1 Tax=unclassified Corynebacterium TaxID=2624378 RepID=UPI001186890A|nr:MULTISPECIES: Fic family protein [unclassified Corynebacterium]MBP3088765.1 Fic family protein [Corynebacterium sp. sy017]TSD92046.1 Fic family protein [Corynebacterium sp. SY003]